MNFKRPPGYKAKPPVDLVRRTPKKGRRRTFIDKEDLSFATLVGPSALKDIILSAHQEILLIGKEIEQLCGKHVRKPGQFEVSLKECNVSPFGLCYFPKGESNIFKRCTFCDKMPAE